jgi:predicted RNA binding protein YcfA (HicA-like mRNA interferase family)
MPKCEKILKRAQASPSNLRFEELCQLAECYGFVFARQRGSHRQYKHPRLREVKTFQSHDGKAVEYQVRDLLETIESLGETDHE